MPEITLEDLASRLEAVERQLADQSRQIGRKKDWRRVVGLFDNDPDFVNDVVAEGAAIREADRAAAREGVVVILLDTDHLTVLQT